MAALRTVIIEVIDQDMEDIEELIDECKADAAQARGNKRTARTVSTICGIAVIIFGAVLATIPDSRSQLRIFLGVLNSSAGVGVAVVAQYFEPAKFRKRAVDLKHLTHDLVELKYQSSIQLAGLQDTLSEGDEAFVEFRNELAEKKILYQRRAVELGVGV